MERGLSCLFVGCRLVGEEGIKCVLLSRFTVSIYAKIYIVYDKRKEMERQNLSA